MFTEEKSTTGYFYFSAIFSYGFAIGGFYIKSQSVGLQFAGNMAMDNFPFDKFFYIWQPSLDVAWISSL